MNNTIIEIQSKAMYSSWCYHIPTRTLFDCGEGFATYQGNHIFGVERVFISHGHGDHILGLPSLIWSRNSARGDKNKPLTIYYPVGDVLVESIKNFIVNQYSIRGGLNFELLWVEVESDISINIPGTNGLIQIETFTTYHQHGILSLGYRIVETRNRLRPEYIGQDIPKLLKSGIVSKAYIMEAYKAIIFAYALDAYKINGEDIKDAEYVVMDCTFINHKDRRGDKHYTIQESYDLCDKYNVKYMIAAHFSGRYSTDQIFNAINGLNGLTQIITVLYNKPFSI